MWQYHIRFRDFSFLLFLLTWFFGFSQVSQGQFAIGDPIILKSLKQRTGMPTRALIMIPGGKIPNSGYVKLAKAIQKASSVDLWVGIVSCHWTADLCNPMDKGPLGLDSRIQHARHELDLAAGHHFALAESFLGGHSLGGQGAFVYANQNSDKKVPGVLLWASYLNVGLEEISYPVLSLGAELDPHQGRPARFFSFFQEFSSLKIKNGLRSVLTRKPVLILPDSGHNAMVDTDEEQIQIENMMGRNLAIDFVGSVSASFIDLNVPLGLEESSKQYETLLQAYKVTQKIFEPLQILSSIEEDGLWCVHAQEQIALQAGLSDLVFKNDHCDNLFSFVAKHPDVSGQAKGKIVQSYSYSKKPKDWLGIGQHFASTEIACKMNSATKIAEVMSRQSAFAREVTCAEINRQAFDLALGVASETTKERFSQSKWSVEFEDDFLCESGPEFAFVRRLEESSENKRYVLRSPKLATRSSSPIYPGSYYCKLLSPLRALEWLMSDSLL